MKALAAATLIVLSAQTALADCDVLKRQAEQNLAAVTEAGDRYRPIAAEHLADKLLIKDQQPSVKVVSDAIPETERMIGAMNRYLDYMISVKDGGCWDSKSDAAQSMVITLFKAQRDELVINLKRFTEFVKQRQ